MERQKMQRRQIQTEYVSVIGGINMDIHGFPAGELKLRDSNVGFVRMSAGGVGRNIADNIARLGIPTKLLSVLGDDSAGKGILAESEGSLLDMSHVRRMEGKQTSVYLSLMDGDRDMIVAINAMDSMKYLDIDYIRQCGELIERSRLCILDTNLSEEVIAYLFERHGGKEFFVDAVSTEKALKLRDHLDRIHTVKLNKIEAEALTGMVIGSEEDMKSLAAELLAKGLKQVFITMGEKGVFYAKNGRMGCSRTQKINSVNATGAGDAFTAAVAYCHLQGMDIAEAVNFANAAAVIALSCEQTINPAMSVNEIRKKMEELSYVETVYGN